MIYQLFQIFRNFSGKAFIAAGLFSAQSLFALESKIRCTMMPGPEVPLYLN